MNIKVFNIRLNKEHCKEDQNKMNDFLDSVEIKLTSTNFVTTSSVDFWSAVVFYETKKIAVDTKIELTLKEKEIYSELMKWRNDLAINLGWAAFRICHNSHLISIAKMNPRTLDELKKIKNFGEKRTLNYGEEIIAILKTI